LVDHADAAEVAGELPQLLGARPEVVAPQVLGEHGVPGLIVGEPCHQPLEIVEAPCFVPPLLSEVLERLHDDVGLQHVVEHGLEEVHDEVLLEIDAGARLELTGGRRELVDVLLADHEMRRPYRRETEPPPPAPEDRQLVS
jgi:hypothetical protein